MEIPADLEPLWTMPAAIGHNGGPPLETRKPGRPTIATPELHDKILDLLSEGIPLRAICREEGMPSRSTIYSWRRTDPAFDRLFDFVQVMGYDHLTFKVVAEIDRLCETHGAKWARWIFNIRCQQLARMNPRYFGGKDMKY
jgi:hypothetical protein